MILAVLPPELVDVVCSHCRHAELHSLALTSSFFYTIARRHIFRRVSVSPHRRNLAVVDLFARDGDKARLVRDFSVDLRSAKLLRGYYQTLSIALSRMTELVHLELYAEPRLSWILPAPSTPHFSKLLHFCSSFSLDSHVAKFLEGTNALLELEIQSSASYTLNLEPLPLPVTAIPHLSQFVGSADAAEAIVPGRPIRAIHVTSGDLPLDALELLALSSAPVAVFGAFTTAPPLEILNRVVKLFPSLSHLQIMASYGFAEASHAGFYDRVAQALSALPDLQAFELSGTHWNSVKSEVGSGNVRVWQSIPPVLDYAPQDPGYPSEDDLWSMPFGY